MAIDFQFVYCNWIFILCTEIVNFLLDSGKNFASHHQSIDKRKYSSYFQKYFHTSTCRVTNFANSGDSDRQSNWTAPKSSIDTGKNC